MKKICFYTESVFDLGGIQRVVTDLANNLCEDYDITILCTHLVPEDKKVNYNLNENIKVDYLPKTLLIFRFYNFIFMIIRFLYRDLFKLSKKRDCFALINYKSRLNILKSLEKYVNDNNFDYIVAEGLNCSIYLSLVKNNVHKKTCFIGCWHSSFDRYTKEYPDKLVSFSLKTNDKTIVLSKNDKKLIKQFYKVNTICIYNPINRLDNKCTSQENKFIAVGRYNKIKGYDKLITSFYLFNKTNKNWKLEIIGDGEERENLQKLIDKYNLNNYIKLTGKTNNIGKYYNSAKVFLMTSKFEGLPMVLLEAMQHKLPIITTDIPIVHEILPSKVPIVPQNDVALYAKIMENVVTNKDNINSMVDEYDEFLELFYIDTIVNKWKSIFK